MQYIIFALSLYVYWANFKHMQNDPVHVLHIYYLYVYTEISMATLLVYLNAAVFIKLVC